MFAQQHSVASKPLERLREVPRAQRRSLAEPLADLAHRYPDAREAMARAYQTGVYSMQDIADYFGVHYATVSRSVRRLESGRGFRGSLTSMAREDA